MGYRASMYKGQAVPPTHLTQPIPQLEALPLTFEAFLPYGRVAQAFSAPTAAPRGIIKTTANQGTAAKYHKMALVEDNHNDDEQHRTLISTMKAQPKTAYGSVWDVSVLEKHPRTTQTFVPLGATTGKTSAYHKGSYLVIVALSNDNGEPDLGTLRAFLAMPNQSVTYGINVWHHGTLTVDSEISYAAIESTTPALPEADIALYKPGGVIAKITIPHVSPPKSLKRTEAVALPDHESSLGLLKNTASYLLGNTTIPCLALTDAAFKPYGQVIQTFASAEDAPQGISVQAFSDGKTIKFHEVAPVKSLYPKEAHATVGVSVFRSTVKDGMRKGKPWPIHFLERHSLTEQAFLPMGVATVSLCFWQGHHLFKM